MKFDFKNCQFPFQQLLIVCSCMHTIYIAPKVTQNFFPLCSKKKKLFLLESKMRKMKDISKNYLSSKNCDNSFFLFFFFETFSTISFPFCSGKINEVKLFKDSLICKVFPHYFFPLFDLSGPPPWRYKSNVKR